MFSRPSQPFRPADRSNNTLMHPPRCGNRSLGQFTFSVGASSNRRPRSLTRIGQRMLNQLPRPNSSSLSRGPSHRSAAVSRASGFFRPRQEPGTKFLFFPPRLWNYCPLPRIMPSGQSCALAGARETCGGWASGANCPRADQCRSRCSLTIHSGMSRRPVAELVSVRSPRGPGVRSLTASATSTPRLGSCIQTFCLT